RKNYEHDSGQRFRMFAETPERNEVKVRCVQHEFDADEDDDGVAACQRTGQADGKQKRAQEEIAGERTHFFPSSFIAIITATIKAAVKSRPTTSSGRTNLLISELPICWTVTSVGAATVFWVIGLFAIA